MSSRCLTAFQLLMRDWSALAPYNFIHAMHLARPADMDRWQNAVTEAMQALFFEPAPAATRVEQPTTDLEMHLETELHRPFSSLATPVRFFAIEKSSGGHWFGAVIDHWVADDFSCRLLLQRLYSKYQGLPDGAQSSRLERTCPVGRRPGLWREWRNFFKQTAELRRACRTPLRDALDFSVRTFPRALPDGALDAVQRFAKAHGATVHDVFLAATAQAFGAARQWETETKRNAVAVGSVMDRRRFEAEPERSGFGLFLGQYIVTQQRPHDVPLPELIKHVAGQSRRMKAGAGTDLFRPTLSLYRLSRSRHAKAAFFVRGAPLVAGLSNVNLTGSWIEQSGVTEYRRIGPTGPIVPMTIMVTTLRGRIFFDITYRTAAFSPLEAERLIGDMIHRLPS